MVIKKIPYLYVALTAVLLGNEPVCAETAGQNIIIGNNTYDESAMSSLLLAAGMYGGLNNESASGVNLALGETKNIIKGVFSDQGLFHGQNITLSYEGSEGRLGFSAGYIYTADEKDESGSSVLLGLDNYSKNSLNSIHERPWYVTLDLSRSFQLSDNLAVGIGSKAVLLANNTAEENSSNQAVSMSLNLPLSYKGFLTVTPEFQWSRTLLPDGEQGAGLNDLHVDSGEDQDTFYGGMSISFSY